MPSAHDIAAYVIAARPPDLTTMKLQKLLFYTQAWSLAWDDAVLFPETIRAWAGGPVVHEVFDRYRGQRLVTSAVRGDPSALSEPQRATVDAVLELYGALDGDTLSELTHREEPWLAAWRSSLGVKPSPAITPESLRAFYRPELVPTKHFPESFRRGVEFVLSLDPEELANLLDGSVSPIDAAAEVAFLEGRGPDPWRA